MYAKTLVLVWVNQGWKESAGVFHKQLPVIEGGKKVVFK